MTWASSSVLSSSPPSPCPPPSPGPDHSRDPATPLPLAIWTHKWLVLTTFNPWSPMVVVVNRYGRPGLWIVKEKQKRKNKEQGPHDLTTTQWPLWQTGRGPIAAADALAVENRIFGNSLKLQKISLSSLKSVNRSQTELWHGTTLYIIFFSFLFCDYSNACFPLLHWTKANLSTFLNLQDCLASQKTSAVSMQLLTYSGFWSRGRCQDLMMIWSIFIYVEQ